ncbi:uncharacterized protein LOC132167724 [Corylus avellana]|uniref:uncharacterized protein LOC132167724 n=1 Tax=Corylus avellana TaxID=13451 RepID=UPI001E22A50F|nr:uncharacterized protein LOC132167724 [Corylus avellana]
MEIIKHFSHKHVLSLSEKKRGDNVLCNACYDDCDEGRIYSCRESVCNFDLHESCAKLPQELHNPLLHPHPLSLVFANYESFGRNCKACGNTLPVSLIFRCDKCKYFKVDVKCAFIRPAIEEGEEEAVVVGTHFSHRHHPLLPLENIPAHRFNCSVCGKYCSDPKTYGCLPCGFFLHPSCFKLPEEIFHPFHPYHPLTGKRIKKPKRITKDDDDADVKCNACRKDIPWDTFAYVCECKIKCSFCLQCASVIMPAITYQGHDHLLLFNDNIRKIECSACNKSSACESYGGFRCLYCDCNLHLTCGPLPSTIKHKSHIHPLIPTHSLAEHEDETQDEFYCDACEEERDPFLPIYSCAECHFVAEISCVISEVKSRLNGDYGDVELRNPLGQFGKVIITRDTAKEFVQKKDQNSPFTWSWMDFVIFIEDENMEEQNRIADSIKEATTAEKIEAYDHEEIIMFSDKAYTHFIDFLNHSQASHSWFSSWFSDYSLIDEEVVNVGDYMTTRKLAPILNHLLSNHGDIGAQSTLSPQLKSHYFFMLCECIDRMRNTKVVDITDYILLNWWTCLKTLQFAGFKIEFVFDRLKRVTHAHFGLYVEKHVDSVVDQLDRDIEKLEALTRKRERIKSAKSAKSLLIEECLREAYVLRNVKAITSRLL